MHRATGPFTEHLPTHWSNFAVNHASLLNLGIISSKPASGRKRKDAAKRTLVVTGIARSGTSLVAGLLRAAGVFMGEFMHEVVSEDAQILELARHRDLDTLKTLIRDRNACHDTWGFKLPTLHAHLRHNELAMFRNPHLVIIYRDPVAIAVRNGLSEHFNEIEAVAKSANAMHSLAQFAHLADCPALMLSYEKALTFPNLMIDSVLEFCGLQLDATARGRLLMQVQPNRPEYLAAASSTFEGHIDGILDGQLYGWCCQVGRLEPVRLELYADDRLIEKITADTFREDLASFGIGNGCHGFFVDLNRHRLHPHSVIRMKIANRVLELDNSGCTLGSLREAVSA